MSKSALCAVDDSCCFHDIRLGPKTSVYRVKHVIVVSTVTGCDVTNCATTLQVVQQAIFVLFFLQKKHVFDVFVCLFVCLFSDFSDLLPQTSRCATVAT